MQHLPRRQHKRDGDSKNWISNTTSTGPRAPIPTLDRLRTGKHRIRQDQPYLDHVLNCKQLSTPLPLAKWQTSRALTGHCGSEGSTVSAVAQFSVQKPTGQLHM
jgi:hypothetical protein